MSATLSGKQERAALLMADDKQTDKQIAASCGVTERTIERWRTLPAMAARIAEHRRVQAAALTDAGIANRQHRIDRLNRRATLMDQVIAERARARELQKVPGGKTGLLVRTRRGKYIMFEVDTGLLAELRAHELSAALLVYLDGRAPYEHLTPRQQAGLELWLRSRLLYDIVSDCAHGMSTRDSAAAHGLSQSSLSRALRRVKSWLAVRTEQYAAGVVVPLPAR